MPVDDVITKGLNLPAVLCRNRLQRVTDHHACVLVCHQFCLLNHLIFRPFHWLERDAAETVCKHVYNHTDHRFILHAEFQK